MIKKLSIAAQVFFLMFCMAGQALAEGFAVYEWSARGVALGGATMARKADPSAVASNPAAITSLKGWNVMAGVSIIAPLGELKFDDPSLPPSERGTYKVKDKVWPMPHLYVTKDLTDTLTLGMGTYTRFGLGLEYPHEWPGRYNIYQVDLQTFSLNPNIAWKATDKLSIAVGLEAMYLDIKLKKRGASPFGDIDFNLSADSWGVGGTLAAHYQFNDQWAAGLMYRSPVAHRPRGNGEITPPSLMPPGTAQSLGLYDQNVHASLVLPESISGGVSWTPVPDLSIETGFVWTRWSRFRHLNIHFDDRDTSYSEKHWQNTWRFNVGVEYMPTNWLALRAGFVWDQCPVTKEYEDYFVPTDNRNIYSIGAGFFLDKWTIDLAYAYLNARGRNYDSRLADNVYAGKVTVVDTHIASLSVSYKF